MKIVILTGGTGSIALQSGLYHTLERNLDGVDIKILVNAYDNGLSTGVVRQVMNGQILGPSDVRKNQATRLQLSHPDSPWLSFLNCRFTAQPPDAYERCRKEVNHLAMKLRTQDRQPGCRELLLNAVDEFFRAPLAAKIAYEDFSLANIIYAGLAKANANSLRAAGTVMASALGIPDSVLLNDDRSLFLGAVTQSGRRVTDEGEIVAWGTASDPFVDLFFVDADGKAAMPELCLEAWQAIVAADLVILSAGTQWSSLIPTYASRGFRAAIADSKAKILMVMNRAPDRDNLGQTASDIINVLVPRCFDARRLHVLIDTNGHPDMRSLDQRARTKIASSLEANLSGPGDPAGKHNPTKLAEAIGHAFFREYVDSDFFLFDYDDTLVGRNSRLPKSSKFNVNGLVHLSLRANVGICTGNSVRAVRLHGEAATLEEMAARKSNSLLVFADGGANAYRLALDDRSACAEIVKCVCSEALLPQTGPYSAGTIIAALRRAGIPDHKIENRGNAVIAIKPVERDYRRAVIGLARSIVSGSDLRVRECGTTTIEIHKPALSKIGALKHLYMQFDDSLRITYVGDECESGNDRDIGELAAAGSPLRCLPVESPAMTAFFVSTLIARLETDANR